jgi:hypothetical protein
LLNAAFVTLSEWLTASMRSRTALGAFATLLLIAILAPELYERFLARSVDRIAATSPYDPVSPSSELPIQKPPASATREPVGLPTASEPPSSPRLPLDATPKADIAMRLRAESGSGGVGGPADGERGELARDAHQEEQRRAAEGEAQRVSRERIIAALEEQKREEEQKRTAALEEQKRQEARKRIAALEEQKRQEEQKRIAALEEQKRQEEQKRIAALSADAPVTKPHPALATPPGPPIQPQATKANSPEQIRQAQTELKRLGCLDGELDGKMTTIEKAIKEFGRRSRKAIVEINITDDFIADLHQQPDDICVLSKKSPAVANRPPPSRHKDAAAASAASSRPPAAPETPARATASSSGSSRKLNVGF